MAKVDLAFPVTGTKIPADHGYSLYSAICHLIPSLHGSEGPAAQSCGADQIWSNVGIHAINARPCGACMLELQRFSRLRIRIDADNIEKLLPLVGVELALDGAAVRLGPPTVEKLQPSARVRSRIVVIKGFVDAEPFLGAVSRQLQTLEIAGRPGIPFRKEVPLPGSNKSPLIRRTLRIRDKVVVGFCVAVEELTAEESIRLQEAGIGGRRRFGCGLFLPAE